MQGRGGGREVSSLETCCRCRDVEEAEVSSSGDALQALPQKRYGALEF